MELSCVELLQNLSSRCIEMSGKILERVIEQNRIINRGIIETFEDLSKKLTAVPTSAAEVFALEAFSNTATKSLIPSLEVKLEHVKIR
jgi:hypothetical protein